ncbi:MAG: signal peptidase II [Chlamydiota bacterium]|nr:signal peptidase II [Chlamydiota bacterium]
MAKSKRKKKFPLVVYFGVFIFLMDFITKLLVSRNLPLMGSDDLWYPYGGIPVFSNFLGIEFSLVHAINRGAAWGIFADYQGLLMIFRIILIGVVINYAIFFNKNRSYDYPFMLIICGALGNILDYFLYGHVVDMFNFVLWGYDYPVFNIADTAICVGIIWLVFFSSPQNQKKRAK